MKITVHKTFGYVLGDGREGDPREPKPKCLDGDVGAALANSNPAMPYTHFEMSHEQSDGPSDGELIEAADVLLHALLPRVSLSEIACVVVRHSERLLKSQCAEDRGHAFRPCAHVYLGNVDLATVGAFKKEIQQIKDLE